MEDDGNANKGNDMVQKHEPVPAIFRCPERAASKAAISQ